VRLGDNGLQASRARHGTARKGIGPAELHDQDHPACRLHATICELVRYYMEDVTIKSAWGGPGAIQLFDHALCDVGRLPVREVVSAVHYVTDLTLGLGEVVFDYLSET
jgi:acetoacetate decarboxylase